MLSGLDRLRANAGTSGESLVYCDIQDVTAKKHRQTSIGTSDIKRTFALTQALVQPNPPCCSPRQERLRAGPLPTAGRGMPCYRKQNVLVGWSLAVGSARLSIAFPEDSSTLTMERNEVLTGLHSCVISSLFIC